MTEMEGATGILKDVLGNVVRLKQEGEHLELRIGEGAGQGTRYVWLEPRDARLLAYILLAEAERLPISN